MKKRFRKCGSCFRYVENWRDAKAKGLEPRDGIGYAGISYKPRKDVAVICTDAGSKKTPKARDNGCKWHKYRWTWNLEMWWRWIFTYNLERWFCKYIRCPIGGLRKPLTLAWGDDFDGMHDKIVKGVVPICPRCGEMPYSYEQCVFCGQRFILDEEDRKKAEPNPEETLTCPQRHRETLVGRRAKINGHFHGVCTNCGRRVME